MTKSKQASEGWSLQAASRLLGIDRNTIRKMIDDGFVQADKQGGKMEGAWRIPSLKPIVQRIREIECERIRGPRRLELEHPVDAEIGRLRAICDREQEERERAGIVRGDDFEFTESESKLRALNIERAGFDPEVRDAKGRLISGGWKFAVEASEPASDWV